MPVKPSTPEEEFFARQEHERKRGLVLAREERLQAEERRALKEQHWMRCPKCGMELIEIDHLGHKVDQCSSCRGLWLDADEVHAFAKPAEGWSLGRIQEIFGR